MSICSSQRPRSCESKLSQRRSKVSKASVLLKGAFGNYDRNNVYGEDLDHAVVCAVRIKPAHGEPTCIQAARQSPGGILKMTTDGGETSASFAFDCVYPPKSTNLDIFCSLVRPCVQKLLKGINSAVFAYGGTGSGKSYTMGFEVNGPEGCLHHTVTYIFGELAKEKSNASVFMNFVEIYGHQPSGGNDNANLIDLLIDKYIEEDPKIKMKKITGHHCDRMISQISHARVLNAKEVILLFHEANAKRHVGDHGFNAKSSRSHGIVQLVLAENNYIPTNQRFGFPKKPKPWSKMSLIDLAGSEPAHMWHNKKDFHGMMLYNQAIVINQGLGALKSCLANLANKPGSIANKNSSMLTKYLGDLMDKQKAKGYMRILFTINPIFGVGASVAQLSRATLEYAKEIKHLKIDCGVEKDLKKLDAPDLKKIAPKFGQQMAEMLNETLRSRARQTPQAELYNHQGDELPALGGGVVFQKQVSTSLQREKKSPVVVNKVLGIIYEGEWKADIKDGEGVWTYPEDHVYRGQFVMDRIHGRGILEFLTNGDKYEGEFVNGEMSGKGKYFHADGVVFEGEYQSNMKHGKGSEIFPSGSRYEGIFRYDEKQGPGKFNWPDGTVYTGQFYNGDRHGEGETLFPDGRKYQGQWSRNKMHGEGKYFSRNGQIYQGQFVNNQRHGYGNLSEKDGRKIVGTWRSNLIHGKSRVCDPDGSEREKIWDMGKKAR